MQNVDMYIYVKIYSGERHAMIAYGCF